MKVPGIDSGACVVLPHQTREAWLETRLDGVGGSEAPVLYGKGFTSEFALWEEKVTRRPADDSTNDKLEAGRVLEPAIAQLLANKFGLTLHSIGAMTVLRSTEEPLAQATLDYLIEPPAGTEPEGLGVLQIKNRSSWEGWSHPEPDWRVFEAGAVPLGVEIQLQHEIAVSGARWGAIGALLSGWKPVIFLRTKRVGFEEIHWPKVREFMRRVREQDPPDVDGSTETEDALRRHFAKSNGETISLDDEAADWIVQMKEHEAQRDLFAPRARLAKNRLRRAMGEADVAIVPGFDRPITNKANKNGVRSMRLPSE